MHELAAAGWSARRQLTVNWSNLNDGLWLAVTAGPYETKEEAEAAVRDLRAHGYEDAYVKYSGEYVY